MRKARRRRALVSFRKSIISVDGSLILHIWMGFAVTLDCFIMCYWGFFFFLCQKGRLWTLFQRFNIALGYHSSYTM